MTRAHSVVACSMLLLVATAAPRARQNIDVSKNAVVQAVTAYVAAYQEEFAYLVADEDYRQRIVMRRGDNDPGTPAGSRHIRGELFLTYLAGDEEWIAVHDVAEVDGRPVQGRQRLLDLLERSDDLRRVAGQIANHNAQFNIGGIIRNFNEPTLPLLIFGPRRVEDVSFDRDAVDTTARPPLVTLSFRERRRPALVHNARGEPVFARGTVLAEGGTGRIRQTTFELDDGQVKVRLETVYRWDEPLDIWVPDSFHERYEARSPSGQTEIAIGDATYTNYRRFETLGRIKRGGGAGASSNLRSEPRLPEG